MKSDIVNYFKEKSTFTYSDAFSKVKKKLGNKESLIIRQTIYGRALEDLCKSMDSIVAEKESGRGLKEALDSVLPSSYDDVLRGGYSTDGRVQPFVFLSSIVAAVSYNKPPSDVRSSVATIHSIVL